MFNAKQHFLHIKREAHHIEDMILSRQSTRTYIDLWVCGIQPKLKPDMDIDCVQIRWEEDGVQGYIDIFYDRVIFNLPREHLAQKIMLDQFFDGITEEKLFQADILDGLLGLDEKELTFFVRVAKLLAKPDWTLYNKEAAV